MFCIASHFILFHLPPQPLQLFSPCSSPSSPPVSPQPPSLPLPLSLLTPNPFSPSIPPSPPVPYHPPSPLLTLKGLRVDFSIYQRVFAILVKSPNAAQAAVDMLLNIERAAVITSRIAARVSIVLYDYEIVGVLFTALLDLMFFFFFLIPSCPLHIVDSSLIFFSCRPVMQV